jgi:hypothetical protein
MKYDMIAITVPMLLLSARALRRALDGEQAARSADGSRLLQRYGYRGLVLAYVAAFVAANAIRFIKEPWYPVEMPVMLAVFALGVWALQRPAAGGGAIATDEVWPGETGL